MSQLISDSGDNGDPEDNAGKEFGPADIRAFIQLQTEELANQKDDREFSRQQLDTSVQLAQLYTATSAEDRRDQRLHVGQQTTKFLIFGGVVVLGVLGFSAYAVANDAKDIVADIFKIGMGGILGFLGGVGFGITKRPKSDDEIEPHGSDES